MLSTKRVIEVNIDYSIRNMVCDFFWENKPIEKSKQEYFTYAKEHYFLPCMNVDVPYNYVEKRFYKRISELKKDIKKIFRKNHSISLNYKSMRDFVAEMECPFKTGKELQNFIVDNF